MRLYLSDDMTAAITWAGTQEEANRLWGRGRWQVVEVPTDKPGLLNWLNTNRVLDLRYPVEPQPALATIPQAPASYAETSLALDEAWRDLPLPRQLHFAALAMESARAALVPA